MCELELKNLEERILVCLNCKKYEDCRDVGRYEECSEFEEIEEIKVVMIEKCSIEDVLIVR